jgi:hypothetical protein
MMDGDEDDEHFPWHYTEYGVLCACGSAMDANENCLSKRRVIGAAERTPWATTTHPLSLLTEDVRAGTALAAVARPEDRYG